MYIDHFSKGVLPEKTSTTGSPDDFEKSKKKRKRPVGFTLF
jgi:hypothetical protein